MPDTPPRGVLLTRPEPGAARTAALLAARGYQPYLAPALTIRRLPARLPDPARIQAVLITSANALAALRPDWHDRPLFAVGAASAERARAAGFSCVRDADGDAASLAALVRRHCEPRHGAFLLLSGRGQGQALAAALRGRGFRLIRRAVYAAVPVRVLPQPALQALRAGNISQALFFSAETARAFLRQANRARVLDSLTQIDAITISESARMALVGVAWRRIRVAARPTQDAMLACLR